MNAPAVARLSSPGEVLAVLPSLCGFPPTESLVVLSLRGARKRVGLTARLDLPPEADEDAVAELCAERMRSDGAGHVVVAVYSQHGRRESLVEAVTAACRGRGVGVLEALHVADDRWTSYTCHGACCPASGSPLPRRTAALALVEAERAASGRAVLASREELVRSVAAPVLLAEAQARQRLQAAADAYLRARVQHGPEAARRSTVEHARALLDRVAEGHPVTPTDAALLTVGLSDVLARDGVATLLLSRPEELLSLLVQVSREVPPPDDAPVCTLLAWVAHARGDGALANVALDRALGGSPDYALALLLRECLDTGITPEEVRGLARAAADALPPGRPRPRRRRGRR